MILTSQGIKYFCVAMKIKSSFSFRDPLPPSLDTPSSFESTLFPKSAADILFSGAHPMELVQQDLNIAKEIRHGNKDVVYNY